MSRTGSPEIPLIIDKAFNQEVSSDVMSFKDPNNLVSPDIGLAEVLFSEEIEIDRPGDDIKVIERSQKIGTELQERCIQTEEIRAQKEEQSKLEEEGYKAAMQAVYGPTWGEKTPIVESSPFKIKERKEEFDIERVEGVIIAAELGAMEELQKESKKGKLGKAGRIALGTFIAGNLLLSSCVPMEITATQKAKTIEPTEPPIAVTIEPEQTVIPEKEKEQKVQVYSIDGTGGGSEDGIVFQFSGVAATPESPEEIEAMINETSTSAQELSKEIVEALAVTGHDIVIGTTFIQPDKDRAIVYFSDENGKPLMLGVKQGDVQKVSVIETPEEVSENVVYEFQNGNLLIVDPEKGDNSQAAVAIVDENGLSFREYFGLETHQYNLEKETWEILQFTTTEEPTVIPTEELTEVFLTQEPTEFQETELPTEEPTAEATAIPPTQEVVFSNIEQVNANIQAWKNGEIPIPNNPEKLPRDRMYTYEIGRGRELSWLNRMTFMNLGAFKYNEYSVLMVGTIDYNTGRRVTAPIIFGIDGTIFVEIGYETHYPGDNYISRAGGKDADIKKGMQIINDNIGEVITVDIGYKRWDPPDSQLQAHEEYVFPKIENNKNLNFNPEKVNINDVSEFNPSNAAMSYGLFQVYDL